MKASISLVSALMVGSIVLPGWGNEVPPSGLDDGALTATTSVGSATATLVTATPSPDAAYPDNLNSCTANDVVTTVVSAVEIGGDDCADGFLDVEWTFEFATTANERYDLGVFISKDGGTVQEPSDALICAGAAPQVGDGDPNSNPDADADDDTFEDNDGGPNTCGDLSTAGGAAALSF